jgi:hypothetical protein
VAESTYDENSHDRLPLEYDASRKPRAVI